MMLALILIVIGAVATVLACKSITAGFDEKDQAIEDRERQLSNELEGLREKRRSLKKELEELKHDFKKSVKEKAEPSQTVYSGSLKDWLVETHYLEVLQLKKAEKYAKEKNLDLLSALLTLNMISVDVFEKAKKQNFR